MDSVKTDNERELTSTMGNVLSTSSKDEKNDTSDATPTSSTDANTTSTASRIVSDDPISSTSSDIVEQNKTKSVEVTMQNYVEAGQAVVEQTDKSSSADPEADLLEMSISNVSNEKITEDVEDLVHDLESLLGESTDSFNVTIKRKEDRKSSEEKDTSDQQQMSTTEGQESSSENRISSKTDEKENVTKSDVTTKDDTNVLEKETREDKPEQVDGSDELNNKESNKQADENHGLEKHADGTKLVSESDEPQISCGSKNDEIGIEEKSLSSSNEENSNEKVTENSVDGSKLNSSTEPTTETKEALDDLTKESEKPLEKAEECNEEEGKKNQELTELSNASESNSEETEQSNEKEEKINKNAQDSVLVPKGGGDVDENVKHTEKEEETVGKTLDSSSKISEEIAKDNAEDEPKGSEAVECHADVKVRENTEGEPSDHQPESEETIHEIHSVSEKETILGDSKTEIIENRDESSEDLTIESSRNKDQPQQEQIVEESSTTDAVEVKDTSTDKDVESQASDSEKESVDVSKEDIILPKDSQDSTSTDVGTEEQLTTGDKVETSPDASNLRQNEVLTCEQVDGINAESEDNKPQNETISNTDTANVDEPEAVSNNEVEEPVDPATEVCSTNVNITLKETETESLDINEPESQVNIPESTERGSPKCSEISDIKTAESATEPGGVPIEVIESSSPAPETAAEIAGSEPVEQQSPTDPVTEPGTTVEVPSLESVEQPTASDSVIESKTAVEIPSSEPIEQSSVPDPAVESFKEVLILVETTESVEPTSAPETPTDITVGSKSEADGRTSELEQTKEEVTEELPAVEVEELNSSNDLLEQISEQNSEPAAVGNEAEETGIIGNCSQIVDEAVNSEHKDTVTQEVCPPDANAVQQEVVAEDTPISEVSEEVIEENQQTIQDDEPSEAPAEVDAEEVQIRESVTILQSTENPPASASSKGEVIEAQTTEDTEAGPESSKSEELKSTILEETEDIKKTEILNPVDEASNSNDRVQESVAETATEESPVAIDETPIPIDTAKSSDEPHSPLDAISKPEAAILVAESTTLIEETSIPNEGIADSVNETSKSNDGIPKPVEENLKDDEKSKPAEETVNLDDSEPMDESLHQFDDTSKSVEATDDDQGLVMDTAGGSGEVVTITDITPNLDDADSKSVDGTINLDIIEVTAVKAVEITDETSGNETVQSNETSKLANEESDAAGEASKLIEEILKPSDKIFTSKIVELEEEESSNLIEEILQPEENASKEVIMESMPEASNDLRSDQNSDAVLPISKIEKLEDLVHSTEDVTEQPSSGDATESNEDNNKIINISDDDSKIIKAGEYIQVISSSGDSDSEEVVPILALEPDEYNPSPKEPVEGKDDSEAEKLSLGVHSVDAAAVAEPMPEIEDILADQSQVDEAAVSIDMQENLETILAVASLQNADSTEDEIVEPQISEKERREMEALRKAVESITETPTVEFEEDVDHVVGELIKDVEIPVENAAMEAEAVELPQIEESGLEDKMVTVEVDKVEDIDNEDGKSEGIIEQVESEGENTDQDVPELRIEDSAEEVEEVKDEVEVEEIPQSLPDTSEDKVYRNQMDNIARKEVLPDSSQTVSASEDVKQSESTKESKTRTNERPRRHRKSLGENKLEELSINIDVPDKEKPYSPKVTIRPIKVPDDEVSTTSNSDTETGKGSLKMTITKQSDKMHSILKICDPESSEAAQEQDEPIPKLIIKPKIQQVEQQHSPKMSTRSSKQVYSPTSSTQRSGSPRITIKPVVKPEKGDTVSPLKIKLKSDETSKKHSPKLNIKLVTKLEEEIRESVQSARKVIIKPVVKPPEELEQVHSPRITIKPIPKPETDKESTPNTPRINIKPIKKQDNEEAEQEKEISSPKITIKPVIKHPEPDTQSPTDDEEVKERIVLKINKGNLPTPTKDPKKREHPPEEDKSEKLAKITVKFSKGGGHPHIVQQPEESNKRSHEEPVSPEKVKKQKTEVESPISTRSKHKENLPESSVETRSKHKDVITDNPANESPKVKQKEIELLVHEAAKPKHKDPISESPIEPKRAKLKETPPETPIYESTRSRHKDLPVEASISEATRSKQKEHNVAEKPAISAENPVNVKVTVVETKVESPIVISEDSRSQDSGSCVIIEDPKDPLSAIPVFEIRAEPAKAMTPKQESVAPAPAPTAPLTPVPRKRGRPRKVPIVVQEEFKEQAEPKPEAAKSEEAQPVQESGRPKRSCRGQSVRATLGIKPRKPRGPGRGRGSKRGMGTRSLPMKPEREPKLTKAKLKLMQATIREELARAAEADRKRQLAEGLLADVGLKAPIPILGPPEIPGGEVPASPSIGLPVPSSQAGVASPALLGVVSPKPAISLTENSTPDSVTPSTSTRVSGEIVMVDEETRMSADTNSRAQTPAKQVVPADAVIEESQSSVQSTATTESGKAASSRPNKAPRLEVQEPEGAVISADQLTEYYWSGNGPFMLQEQVAQFLGIKSFKRKYPGIMRRMLDMQERDFIRESGLASEHMCDLGLTAVNSADILDIMYSDFQDKYEEYCKHQRDRQAKDLINKQKALSLAASQEKNKADITEQAVQSAAQWNASFNKTRKEQRKACMDLQTLTVHYPKGKMKQINKAKVGNYPVALVPGQYTDYYKEFTPTEINNLPINTMCYDTINVIPPEESDDSGSDGSDSDSDSSSSSSDSGSDSSSGVEDCKLCKHSPKKTATTK